MWKEVLMNVEICDQCKKKEVIKYEKGNTVTCEICGKALCKDCQSQINDTLVCTDCKNEHFTKYLELKAEVRDAEVLVGVKHRELKKEKERLRDIVREIREKWEK